MKHFTKNGLLAAASTLLLSSANTFANEYDVNQLIGKYYIGGHAQHFSADDDRMTYKTDPVLGLMGSSLDSGNGLGLEAGYRYSAFSEFRIRATDLSIDADKSGFSDTDGSAIALDYLYFPYKKSLYLVAGLDQIDLDNDELSADLGVGYRHYFKQNLAFYAEAKTHFQFDESYKDFSAQIGLIYFFGDFSSSAPKAAQLPAEPVKAVEPIAAAPVAAAPIDSDNDGVVDSMDNCLKTPAGDKVDAQGCTIFTEVASSLKLLINFDNNKADIKSDYYDEVEKAVELLNKYPHIQLTIEGHSSAQGAAAYNKTLSQKRADAVVALMVEKYDVDASRLSAIGYGEERLINSDNTAAAHAENRRIEAVIEVVEKVAEKK